jgi:hypothetical protein
LRLEECTDQRLSGPKKKTGEFRLKSWPAAAERLSECDEM